jgi:hypothetical protein
MEERIIKTVTMENGLKLELLDESRPIAGDRWLVQLNLRIVIPLTGELVRSLPDGEILHREYGLILEYTNEMKRHFVDGRDRERVLEGFVDIALKEKQPYLSHPDFAGRMAVSRLAELKREKPQLFR